MPDIRFGAGAQTGVGDHTISQGRDDANINIHHTQDLRVWTKRLGVGVEALKQAVSAVGSNAADVQRYLQGSDTGQGQSH